MRFFTRERFDALQALDASLVEDASLSEAEFNQALSQSEWGRASREYRDHLQAASGGMPEDAKRLAALDLHDYQLLAVSHTETDAVFRLGSPWKRPRFTGGYALSFSGVAECVMPQDSIGQFLVEHEVLSNPAGGFDFCSLLDRTESCVRFGRVEIRDW